MHDSRKAQANRTSELPSTQGSILRIPSAHKRQESALVACIHEATDARHLQLHVPSTLPMMGSDAVESDNASGAMYFRLRFRPCSMAGQADLYGTWPRLHVPYVGRQGATHRGSQRVVNCDVVIQMQCSTAPDAPECLAQLPATALEGCACRSSIRQQTVCLAEQSLTSQVQGCPMSSSVQQRLHRKILDECR
jgi:hypothetical protein